MVEDALGERVRDLASGRRAAGVHDTGARMSAFEPEPEVELDSQIGEVGDARRRLVGEDGDGARPAEATARRDRVLGVQSRIVVRADRGGDSALREVARSRLDRALRQHDDVGLVGGAESGVETGDSAAHDEEIALRLMCVAVSRFTSASGSFRLRVDNCAGVYQSFRFPSRKRPPT